MSTSHRTDPLDRLATPDTVDPENKRISDDCYHAGRIALQEGASLTENPYAGTGSWGLAWASGWLDANADRMTKLERTVQYLIDKLGIEIPGDLPDPDRSRRAYRVILPKDEANPF